MRYYTDPKPLSEMTEDDMVEFYALVQENFHYFCEVILGYYDMNDVHKETCEFMQYDRHKNKIFLLPRLTFKSSILTQGYALWQIVRNPNIRILIYSDTLLKAQGFLRGIKVHLQGDSGRGLFKSHIGNYVNDECWTNNSIVINKRIIGAVEPTVDTSGIDSSKVAMHYDLIIFDDIVCDTNVTNINQMNRVYDCYKNSLSLLSRAGHHILIGTRWHYNDMYGRLIADNKTTDEFGIIKRSAKEVRVDGGLIFDNIGPESLTSEYLKKLEEKIGSYMASCLYYNEPVDNEESLFKHENFAFYGRLAESTNPLYTGKYENLFITCTVDPAGMGEDKTGATVIGTDNEMKMYVLDTLNKHLQPSQIVDWIINTNYKYRIKILGVEEKFFRGMLTRELKQKMLEENNKNSLFNMFGIVEFKPYSGQTKFIRIQSLQPYHERKAILFPGTAISRLSGGFAELAHQMLQVTPTHMPEPNDLIDSLAFHTQLIQRGNVVRIENIPKNSPAELEKMWVTRFNRIQRRLPRRMRRKYKTWLT